MSALRQGVVFGVVLAMCSVASASVVTYDSIGPSNTYANWGAWFGHYPGASNTTAMQFTPTVGGWMDALYASIEPDPNHSDRSWTLRLLTDADGVPGGVVLWQRTSESWPSVVDGLFYLDGLDGPWLDAGGVYWLQADKPVVLGVSHLWNANVQDYMGVIAHNSGSGWDLHEDQPVWGLRVLVVPEPATGGMLLLATAGGLLWRRRG